jgi:hypothetical protein
VNRYATWRVLLFINSTRFAYVLICIVYFLHKYYNGCRPPIIRLFGCWRNYGRLGNTLGRSIKSGSTRTQWLNSLQESWRLYSLQERVKRGKLDKTTTTNYYRNTVIVLWQCRFSLKIKIIIFSTSNTFLHTMF